MQHPPAPPHHSPDGRWWWNGQRWIAVAPLVPTPRRRAAPWVIAWITLGCLVLVGVSAAAVALGPPLGRALIDLANSQSSSQLDIASPPGAEAIPTPSDGSARGGVLDVAGLTASVAPGTAMIEVDFLHNLNGGGGTGLVLTPSGLLLTDEHVVTGASGITAQIRGTGTTYTAALIGVDLAEDVALLQLQGASGLRTIVPGRSSGALVGDPIMVIGYPDGPAPTPATGRITGINESVHISGAPAQPNRSDDPKVTYSGMLHTSVRGRPGMSGGPLVDSAGLVIAMAQVGSRADNYDLPIERALGAAREIAAGHASADRLIGAPADLGVVARNRVGTGGTPGAEVVTVYGGSPAESAGVRVGDVITAIDGAAVASAVELRQVLAGHRPGDRVTLTWTDAAGRQHSVRLTLARGPAP
jgi:S1-C subfamily serine protease